ncbi:MAG: Spy/CpxP family protein refolding chaperone [Verrucomicrobia bacterium]|nr:Spy/CpxP family protein refolding chaperone [Verrucomicrobiota bacterium]
MNTNTQLRCLKTSAALLFAAVLSSTLIVSAQPPPDGPAGPDRPRRPEGPRRGIPDPSLSEEQRTAIREAMEASRKDAAPLEEKMRAARKDLQEAIHAEKIDEQVIRAKAADVGKLEGDLAVIRAKAFAKIRPSLSREQIARMKNMPSGFDRPRPPFADGRPGGPRPRGEGFDRPPGRPLPPGEDRGPDGSLPPPPKPRPSE